MIDVNEYLKNYYKGTKNTSLEGLKYFMKCYNNFETKMKFIHIAGTNGKGSCTEMISNILVKQGYKVGKFLSPHLIRYNERISINGKEISDQEMINLIDELKVIMDEYNKKTNCVITLFELEIEMALLYFYRNNVDFVVLETGLGGLKDGTNIITKPLVSVISSIGYDHTAILGDTLEKIAYQKAGIIKENSNTVIFKQTPDIDNIFVQTCKDKNNSLHIVENKDISNYLFDKKFQYFDYKDIKNIALNLKGRVQIRNASLCIETMKILNQLGYLVTEESIKEGLKTIIHKARMEQINDNPIIIYDGAHNEPAMKSLTETVKMYYDNCNKTYIISILKRKDYKSMLKILSNDKNATFILTCGNNQDNFVKDIEMYDYMKKYVSTNRLIVKDLKKAVIDCLQEKTNDATFIVGSFYTYETVINIIKNFKVK